MREIPVAEIGFIGPGASIESPESAAGPVMGSKTAAAFPVSNRSLVLDLGEARLVHQLVMFDDKVDNSGTSPLIAENGLLLYTSSDGLNFKPYTKPFKITIERGLEKGVFERVRIDGLVIMARFIKLHADLPTLAYDFANTNLQQMVRSYQDSGLAPKVVEVHANRYVTGQAEIYARIKMPTKDDSPLWLEVLDSNGAKLSRVAVPEDGIVRQELDVSELNKGAKELDLVLVSEEWGNLTSQTLKLYCASEIHENPEQVLESKPDKIVMLDHLDCAWPTGEFQREGAPRRTVWTGELGDAPLELTLPATGWHAVSIGLIGDSEAVVTLGDTAPKKVKLQVWRQYDEATGLGEAYVGSEDLKATKLTIQPIGKGGCRLAFVRLLGLSSEQIRIAKAARKPDGIGRVTINNDGFSMFYSGTNSKEQLFRTVDKYQGKRLYSYDYCLGSDVTCTYDTKVGTIFGSNVEDFWREGDRRAYEGIQKLINEGNDPLRVVIDRCRSNGQRVHVSFRMNANYAPPNAKTMNGRLYWENYDCRILSQYKKYSYRLSYAYPEVRAYRLAVIKEGLSYGPDGLNLDFLRHPPFVGFDKPLVDAFKVKYGEDPFKVPSDPRWLAMQAEVMTGFVRSVSQVLNEESKRQGRKMTLTVAFDYNGYEGQALDVQRWVKEGLVDQIIPGVHGLGGKDFSVAKFRKMTADTDCELFVRLEHTLEGGDPTPESEKGEVTIHREHVTLNSYRRRVIELYDEGAEGIYLFNNSGVGFIDALSDKQGLSLWDAFERPLIDWFERGQLVE